MMASGLAASPGEVTSLLSAYVELELRRVGWNAQAHPQVKTTLLRLATRYASSLPLQFGGQSSVDEFALLRQLSNELEAAGNRDKARRLQDLVQKLAQTSALGQRTRWALLSLFRQVAHDKRSAALAAIDESAFAGSGSAGGASSTLPLSSVLGLSSLDSGLGLGGLSSYGGEASKVGLGLGAASTMRQPLQPMQLGSLSRPASAAPSLSSSMQYQPAVPQQYTVTYPPSVDGSFAGLSGEFSRASLSSMYSTSGTTGGGTLSGTMGGTQAAHQQSQRGGQQQQGGGSGGRAAADGALAYTAKEPVLVRDVLYSCQGVNGRSLAWQDADPGGVEPDITRGFKLDQGVAAGLSASQKMAVARLSELGVLFKLVQAHARPGAVAEGYCRQALCGALADELADYYRLVALLEAQTAVPIPVPAAAAGGESAAAGTPQQQQSYLTLRRLACWLGEPTRRMRLLAALAEATRGLSGGALVGAVWAASRHGDPFVAAYASKLLSKVCVPLSEMVVRWVFEGQLEDPHGEFFIRANTDLPPGGDLWRQGYGLEPSALPPFINTQLAHAILRAGKAINFLRSRCEDGAWVARHAAEGHAAAASADLSQAEPLAALVSRAVSAVDSRLLGLLVHGSAGSPGSTGGTASAGGGLIRHLDALRRYVLLGQGDWVAAMLDMASRDLDKSATEVSELALGHCLRQAVAASNARYDDEDLTDRLRATKARSVGDKELGWDVFAIKYIVNGPLTAILTPQAMAKYGRVSALLWRLKRAEWVLGQVWTRAACGLSRTLNRMGLDAAAGRPLVQSLLGLRGEMSHFVTNLQYYLQFEVLESSWQALASALTSSSQQGGATDLDQVIAAHESYLDSLLRRALLDERCSALAVTLRLLLENICDMRQRAGRVAQMVEAAEKICHNRVKVQAQKVKEGQWGSTEREVAEQAPVFAPAELAIITAELADAAAKHRKLSGEFADSLPEEAAHEVRFLLARLDFSDFYTRQHDMAVGTAGGGAAGGGGGPHEEGMMGMYGPWSSAGPHAGVGATGGNTGASATTGTAAGATGRVTAAAAVAAAAAVRPTTRPY